jgi:hypothetical protein
MFRPFALVNHSILNFFMSNHWKLAVFAGTSSGIGAISDCLAARNYDLVLVARRAKRRCARCDGLPAAHGVPIDSVVADSDERRQPGPSREGSRHRRNGARSVNYDLGKRACRGGSRDGRQSRKAGVVDGYGRSAWPQGRAAPAFCHITGPVSA